MCCADVTCVFSSQPGQRRNVTASKAHGRVDAVFLVIQILLALVFTFDDKFKDFLLLAVTWLAVVVMAWTSLQYAPVHHHRLRSVQAAMIAAFAWACACSTLLIIRGRPTVRSVQPIDGFVSLSAHTIYIRISYLLLCAALLCRRMWKAFSSC